MEHTIVVNANRMSPVAAAQYAIINDHAGGQATDANSVCIGKTAGTKLSGKASTLGGVILIIIGLEIFLSNIL